MTDRHLWAEDIRPYLEFDHQGRRWEVLRRTPSHAMPGWVCRAEGAEHYLDDRTICGALTEHPLCAELRRWVGDALLPVGDWVEDWHLTNVRWDEDYEEALADLEVESWGLVETVPLILRRGWDEPQILAHPDPETLLAWEEMAGYLWCELRSAIRGLRARGLNEAQHQYLNQYAKEAE